jgi:hypothetical protein
MCDVLNVEGEMGRISSDDLYPVINQVEEYPVTSDELAVRARETGAGDEVAEFFESIPGDTMFNSEEEILNMAEQIDPSDMSTSGSDTLGEDLEEL